MPESSTVNDRMMVLPSTIATKSLMGEKREEDGMMVLPLAARTDVGIGESRQKADRSAVAAVKSTVGEG
jgi:hypothetical protein